MSTTSNDKMSPIKRAPTQPLPPGRPTPTAPGSEATLDSVPTGTGGTDSGTPRP